MMRGVGRKSERFSDAKNRTGKEDQLRWVSGFPSLTRRFVFFVVLLSGLVSWM